VEDHQAKLRAQTGLLEGFLGFIGQF